ncbi:hypothetical protein PS723_06266 [Pseudomonas fluorescens]|uniref:Uncharacterized protein n=1 Tax=Pseudomonas fluorescens TaxID=294 RepID=A0A5E7FXA1_PSEFL|nr:hypothetical protein PS723_06266 [Pseudomonas fluorescens]
MASSMISVAMIATSVALTSIVAIAMAAVALAMMGIPASIRVRPVYRAWSLLVMPWRLVVP